MTTPIALVTGGASGIGAEVCRRLATHGYGVAVCDQNMDLGQQLADEIQVYLASKLSSLNFSLRPFVSFFIEILPRAEVSAWR